MRKAHLVHNGKALLNGVNKVGLVSIPGLDSKNHSNGRSVLARSPYPLDRPFSLFHGIFPASHLHAGGTRNNNRRTRDGSGEIGHLFHVIDCFFPPISVRRRSAVKIEQMEDTLMPLSRVSLVTSFVSYLSGSPINSIAS